MSEATHVLDFQLRSVLDPLLAERGFRFDRLRTFRRVRGDGSVQIVNVQVGERSMASQFTVNLGVFRPGDQVIDPKFNPHRPMEYHCPPQRRERLGRLRPTLLYELRRVPVLGVLGQPRDHWWKLSDDPRRTAASLRDAGALLVDKGLPWLESR